MPPPRSRVWSESGHTLALDWSCCARPVVGEGESVNGGHSPTTVHRSPFTGYLCQALPTSPSFALQSMSHFYYEPTITLLARPVFTTPEHLPVNWIGESTDGERLAEFAGRVCY